MTSTTTRSRPPRRVAVIGAALVIYLGTAALFVAVASSMLGVSRRGGGGALFGERIAIVELEGLIVDVDDQVRELRAYRDNPGIRAVVLRINSPGGAVAPTQELY